MSSVSSVQPDPNRENFQFIADLYAEVLGVLALDSFISVRRRFASELKGLRSEPQTEHNTKAIISLIKGLKFYRVKMYPVEAFENSFMLLHECANYYLEVKDKSIKYALAGLLVEILIPVAAVSHFILGLGLKNTISIYMYIISKIKNCRILSKRLVNNAKEFTIRGINFRLSILNLSDFCVICAVREIILFYFIKVLNYSREILYVC